MPLPAKTIAIPLAVCVVIVSYNRCSDLIRCLTSLQRQAPALARVVVVDNGSQDDTIDAVLTQFPWVELYAAESNLGPCIARNAGVARSHEDLVWFLDSDTEIPDSDGAARLTALFDRPEIVAVGGEAVLDTNGRIAGVKRLRLTANAMVQGDTILPDTTVSPCRVIASCNLMMRRGVFDRLGGFDPFYFFFYEDMDLTFRASRLGTLLALSPMPVIHRFSEKMRINSLWMVSRNRMYFTLKNLPLWRALLLPVLDLATIVRIDSLRRLLRRSRQGPAAVSSVTIDNVPSGSSGAALRRGAAMALELIAKLAITYAALPFVLRPALASRARLAYGAPTSGTIRRIAALAPAGP